MGDAIGRGKPVVASKAVEHQRKPLIPFHVAWAFEVFVDDSTHDIS